MTFHIRDGMQWSDGEAADSADVCYSWGLAIAAIADESSIGSGYLDPGLSDAGVTKIECPDASTFIAYTTDQSERIFQIYMPILPEHIHGELDYKEIAEEKFDGPLVGSGPYTLAEWQTGQFARFVRNPNFWGTQGFADEVVLRFFADNTDVMTQALKAGELDYAHDVNADQFKQLATDPLFTAVEGKANGWTQLAFNTYGTGTGKTIEGGGPSTKALLDTAFRDALGYAVDRDALVERVLGGFGDPGNTIVPPVLSDWHVEPDRPRTFDIELAKQKLDAAGYVLDADGKRLDKEGKPIVLALAHPNTSDTYSKSAQFIKEWYAELGIDVSVQSYDSDTLDRPDPAAGGGWHREVRHRAVGLGREPGPQRPDDRVPLRPDREPVGLPVLQPRIRRAVRQAVRRGGRGATRDPGADAEPDLRRGAVRHPVLRLEPRRLPQRPVRRLAEPARQRHAVLHLRHPQLHAADRRDPRAVAQPCGALGVRRVRRIVRTGGDRRTGHRLEHRRLGIGHGAPARGARGRGRHRRRRVRAEPATHRGGRRGRVTPATRLERAPGEGRHAALASHPPGDAMSGRYIGRKLVQAIVTIVAIVLLNFVLFRIMPGSPERQSKNPHLTPEIVAANRIKWGLDKPLIPDQLVSYIASTAQGDLGYSIKYRGQPVVEVVAGAAGPTVLLIGLGEAVAIVVGLWLGARSGWRRGGVVDRVGNALSLVFYSMPYFVIGMPLIIVFAAGLGWFPTSGMTTPGRQQDARRSHPRPRPPPGPPADGDRARAHRGVLDPHALLDRRDAVGGLHHDGAGEGPVGRPDPRAHAFPNALLPMVTLIAINLGYVVAGAITAEIVFNWPGLGTLTVQALDARDYPLLQAIFLLIAISVVFANFAADIVYGYLDPRVRT